MTKEYRFKFSGELIMPILWGATITEYMNKIVALLGGQRFYIDYDTLVVVV